MDFSMSPVAELKEIPVFVYGTLRSGGSLHHLIRPHIAAGPYPASTTGSLGLATAGNWPVLLDSESDSDSKVVGEVIIVRLSQESLRILGVEELAYGYSLVWRSIETDEFHGKAVLCHWPWEDGFSAIIGHGDWLKYLAENSS